MKNLGLLVMPLMAISFLASCNQPTPTPVVDVVHNFHFIGTNCTINGESEYSHDIYEKDKNVQYTIVPYTGYKLPETIEGVEYNPSNGVITISEIKSDIELRVEATHIPQPGVTHTIYLDPAGGKITGSTILINLPDNEPITTAPTISRDGYDASEVKWYTEPDGGGQEFKFGEKGTLVVTDYFLHAKWGEIAKPIVHYMEEDGISELKQEAVTYGNSAPYYKPTKTNYRFANWYNKKPSETEAAVFDFKTKIKAETYIYAKWESTVGTTYNVKFNIDNCSMTYNGDPVDATTGVNIVVPQGVNPYYVKFSVKANDSIYMKPSDVTLNSGAYTDYIFNKDKGELVINLQQNIVVTGTCDMYKSLEECSWAQISEISELGKAYEAFEIGDTKTVKVNELDHTVRIIGFSHDELSTSTTEKPKYAGITFEFANVITDSNGNAITTIWDGIEKESGNNFDYRNSVLHKRLNVDDDCIFDELPEDLKEEGIIKTVKKIVGVSTDDGYSYTATAFATNKCPKLFPLAHDEITKNRHENFVTSGEGSTYEYYKYHDDNNSRIKKAVNGSAQLYWLRSPTAGDTGHAWYCGDSGYLRSYSLVYYRAYAVAPAFCI